MNVLKLTVNHSLTHSKINSLTFTFYRESVRKKWLVLRATLSLDVVTARPLLKGARTAILVTRNRSQVNPLPRCWTFLLHEGA